MIRPRVLIPENFRDGYISAGRFYNHFHDGLCAPYLRNPNYMLIVDFRYSKRPKRDVDNVLTLFYVGHWTNTRPLTS